MLSEEEIHKRRVDDLMFQRFARGLRELASCGVSVTSIRVASQSDLESLRAAISRAARIEVQSRGHVEIEGIAIQRESE